MAKYQKHYIKNDCFFSVKKKTVDKKKKKYFEFCHSSIAFTDYIQ